MIECRVFVRRQRPPVLERLIPRGAARGMRTALQISECGVVGRDHARLRAPFDAHVADRHPAFHAQAAHGRAAVLDQMTLAKRRSGAADQPEHHVFGRHAERKLALDSHREVASSRLRQALGRQHELDLGCADAKRQSAKCSMSGGMRVAADDQHPGLRQAELGTDDVHDALAPAADLMQRDAFAPAVLRQHLHLLPRRSLPVLRCFTSP